MLLLSLVGLLPLDNVPLVDHVDVIKLNHYFDGTGKHQFDQFIFWQWCHSDSVHHVIDWRFVKSRYDLRQRRRYYYLTFRDTELLRVVRATHFRETWTQHDPEVDDRAHLPQGSRRRLTSFVNRKHQG